MPDGSRDYWKIDYGGITRAFRNITDFVVFSVEPPWSSCSTLFPNHPNKLHVPTDLETKTLDRYVTGKEIPRYVAGVGGGTAIDAAKYFAIRTGCSFISVPTVVSVVAYFTPKAAVRRDGVVSFVGEKFPDLIVIDFPVIRSAPRRLNIAGCGDLYCASVALLDWKLARDRLGEEYDEQIVKKSYELIERLLRTSEDIRSVTENGIKTMIEIGMAFFRLHRPYEEKNKLWPDQGVEHVFFYGLEKLTGRSFIHGEVVGTGCVVGSYLHGTDVSKTIRELDSLGLRFRPAEIGISRDEFAAVLQTMNKISHKAGFQYLILDEFELDQSDISELWKILS